MNKILPLILLLSSCATRPPFQKLDNGTGYSVKETPIPEILELHYLLPSDTKEEYRLNYLARAAGEECAARHFPYFDFGIMQDGYARAFCSSQDKAANLGATFGMIAAPHGEPELRVAETQIGKHSQLNSWDVIRKIGDRDVHSLGELKEALYLLGRKGETETSLHVERSEIPLLLENKIFMDSGKLMTPVKLQALREEVP
jgi:hypothetical protein